MLLISGCSFIENHHFPLLAWGDDVYFDHLAKMRARSGAGNQYIARTILENLVQDVDRVFVLWSGLCRIDITLPMAINHQVQGFWHHHHTYKCTWFNSGGFQGFWNMDTQPVPMWIKKYLRNQYLAMDWEYLATNSFTHVVGCLNTLEARGINYSFGFIADPFVDHSHEPSLGGGIDRNNPLINLINWDKCLPTYPYDYCREHGLLSEDRFHPSEQGYRAWIDSIKHRLPVL
jgi:hypothetical protein